VNCHTCREALSARLDGEDRPSERAAVDTHLASCADCRDWYAQAEAVGRLLRTALPAPPSPGVAEDVLAALPGPGRARSAGILRWVLGGLGVAQFLLGVVQIASLAGSTHVHVGQVASAGHLWHESAAWNLAVGAGFGWVAARRARPAGIVPVLTVFVATLLLLSAGDVTAGRVAAVWLLSHGVLLAGYVIVVLLGRPGFDFGDPPAGRGTRRWSLRVDDDLDTDPRPAPGWRTDRAGESGRPAAHRRDVA
jgi:predicted anti-sigma-YlaC factor YlaD